MAAGILPATDGVGEEVGGTYRSAAVQGRPRAASLLPAGYR